MLTINVLRVCKVRGIARPFSFFRDHGFSISSATRIAAGRMSGFSLETVEKLCLLLNCTPNDLFQWTPSKDSLVPPSHALYTLQSNEVMLDIAKLVSDAPLEKLKKMQEIIARELGG